MANLAMDFLHPVEDVVKGVVQGVANPVAKVLNDVGAGVLDTDALVELLQHNTGASISAQEKANAITKGGGGLLHQGGVTGEVTSAPLSTKNYEQIAGTGAEIGSNLVGGEGAGAVASDVAKNGAKNLGMDFIKGATSGAEAGATYQAGAGATQGQFNPEQIAQGAVEGAAAGGALGAAVPAVAGAIHSATPLNEVGAIGNIPKVSDQIDPEDLDKITKSDDPDVAEQTLEPTVGPVVAKEIAPAVASAKDPNVISNIVDNAVNNKVSPAVGEPQQPLSNQDVLNEFSKNRSSYGDDQKFYNEFVQQAADMPNKGGDLAIEIMGQVENDDVPVKEALDNSLKPDNATRTPLDTYHEARTELTGIAQRNNQPQLIQQFDDNTKGMSVEDKTNYLNNALNNYRSKGGFLAEHLGQSAEAPTSQPEAQPAPQAQIQAPTPTSDVNLPSQVNPEEQSLFNTAEQPDFTKDAQEAQQSGFTDITPKDMEALYNRKDDPAYADEMNPYRAENQSQVQHPGTPPVSPEDASLFNKEPEQDFMNAPGETPKPTTLTKAGVMSDMADMVNSGQYNNDEVLNHYYTTVPNATIGDAHDALDQVLNSVGVDKSKINASLNPKSGATRLAPVKEGDQNAALLNGRDANRIIHQSGDQAIADMEPLDAHDRELTRYLRGKGSDDVQALIQQADDPVAFEKFVNSSREYNDTAQALGAEQGQPLPYRANYGGRTLYEPPEGFKEGPEGQEPKPSVANAETPAYTKQRYFNTHEEALANGYVPTNEDPLEDLKSDVNQRALNNTQLALANGYEKAYPGQVAMLNDTTPVPSGYRQLLVPGGQHIALPDDIAAKINDRIATKTSGSLISKYDTVNQAGKELELGGGTFHGFNTLMTHVGQQVMSGKIFTDPGASLKVLNNFFNKGGADDYFKANDNASVSPSGGLDENHSTIDGANAVGLNIKNASVDLVNPGEKNLAGKVASIPGLKQIHDAVFNRQIPTMMLEQFKQKTQGLDIFGSADDRLAAEKIARGINKEFGVTDHDLAGLTNQQFKNASRVILAPGYQEGVMHTLLTALDPREFGTAEGKLAREAVIGKALVMGGIATLGGVAGGDFKGMDAKDTALAIMNKAINPSFNIRGYKVSTPATNISDIAKPVEESIAGYKKTGDALTGAEDFANSHLAFAPAKAEEIAANKNYEGNPIHGTDYYGRPISGAETAENLASGILPIPLAQGEQTATGAQSPEAAVANTVGFNAQPTGDMQYAPVYGQTYMSELEQTPGIPKAQLNADSEFFEALGSGKTGRAKVLTQAESDLAQAEKATDPATQAKLRAKAVSTIDTYNKQLVKALVPWADSKVNTSYLDPTMLSILRSTMITIKSASSNVNYDIKTNPTAYGVPVQALESQPQTAALTT